MYRFALRPAWIVSHVLVALLIVILVNLGFWQLRRHDERAERNATVEARSEQPPITIGDGSQLVAGDVEELRYRPVTATGAFVDDATLLIDNRSSDGLPGGWAVTPLRLDDGSLLAVSRGFLRFDEGVLDPPAPPDGQVRIEGTLLPWDDGCGTRTDDTGAVVGAACLDQEAMEAVAGAAVLPVAVQLVSSSAGDQGLTPVPLPELDAGPHRSYAVQWFIFASIAVVGYPLVLRRVARDRASESDGDRVEDRTEELV